MSGDGSLSDIIDAVEEFWRVRLLQIQDLGVLDDDRFVALSLFVSRENIGFGPEQLPPDHTDRLVVYRLMLDSGLSPLEAMAIAGLKFSELLEERAVQQRVNVFRALRRDRGFFDN